MNLQVLLVSLFLSDEDAVMDFVDWHNPAGTHVCVSAISTAQVQFVKGRSHFPACIPLLIEHS
jgi:hypothetical protein